MKIPIRAAQNKQRGPHAARGQPDLDDPLNIKTGYCGST